MLKKLLLLTMAIGVMSACAPAPATPPDTSADEAKMKADLQKWMADFNTGNADGLASQYAEDAVLMPPNAPVATGRSAIRAALAKESEGARAAGLTFKSTATTGIGVNGDMAWMSGNYAVTDASGTTVDVGKYLSVHKRINGQWLYVRDTWNSDNPPPAPPPPPPAPAKK